MVLDNERYEVFAQALARGKPQAEAYVEAGYKRSEPHASRLARNGKVRARVAELQAEAVSKLVSEASFEAADLFRRLQVHIDAAQAAGDHKTALDGIKFMISCFGYADSPTLTHEHVRGKSLKPPELEENRHPTQVVRFSKVLAELRKRRSGEP